MLGEFGSLRFRKSGIFPCWVPQILWIIPYPLPSHTPRQKSNDEPFANADAAFTLAYAIIMLNVDQHNHNVRKNTVPMTRDDFKRNLKKVNGGSDFNQEMLDDIYTAIK